MTSSAEKSRQRQAGHSAAEAMVATAIFLIVTTSVFQVFTQNQRGYDVQVELNDAQLTARGVVLEVDRIMRATGYGMPVYITAVTAAIAAATGTDITESRELRTMIIGTSNATQLDVRGNYRVPSVEGVAVAATTSVTSPTAAGGPYRTARVEFSSTAVRDQLVVDDPVYLYDQNSWHYGLVTSVTAVTATVADVGLNFRSASTATSKSYPIGSLLRRRETASISFADGQVSRTVAGATDVIGTNIQSLTFRYFKSDGTELTTFPMAIADRIAITTIQLTVVARTRNRDPRTGQYRTASLTTRFALRMVPS